LGPEFDEDGFLRDPGNWSEALAERLAQELGVSDLTKAHWRVLRYLREHYLEHGALPVMAHVCRVTGLEHHCVEHLFAQRPLLAWKLAGLPNPGEEVKTYL
jgi:tRNA 2-thiouridine synthesizing protein E